MRLALKLGPNHPKWRSSSLPRSWVLEESCIDAERDNCAQGWSAPAVRILGNPLSHTSIDATITHLLFSTSQKLSDTVCVHFLPDTLDVTTESKRHVMQGHVITQMRLESRAVTEVAYGLIRRQQSSITITILAKRIVLTSLTFHYRHSFPESPYGCH